LVAKEGEWERRKEGGVLRGGGREGGVRCEWRLTRGKRGGREEVPYIRAIPW